uniref:Uncharacterized protein n=1 Tax=Cantharellus lutescens TaxID=104198 RepID=A0A2S0S4G0_9AGAM|nr:hypothetical protein [Cantharellus lutescens]AWA82235.1 hypothetical protein [Cantharellus lutescens]
MKTIFNLLIINLTFFFHYLNNLVKLVYQIPSTILIKNIYFNLLLVTGITVLILIRLGYLQVNLFDLYTIIHSNLLTLLILSFMLITLTTYIVYILMNFCYRVYCTCCYIDELIIYSLSQGNKDSMKISNSNFIRLDILILYILKNIFFILFSLYILHNIYNILDIDIFIIFILFIFSSSIAYLWLRWNDPYSLDNNYKNFNLLFLLLVFTLYVIYIYLAPELVQKFMFYFTDKSFLDTNTILSIKESKKAILPTTKIVPKLDITTEEMQKHLDNPFKTSWADIDPDGSFIYGNNLTHFAYTFSFRNNENTDISLSYFYFSMEEFLAYAKMKYWMGSKLGYDQFYFKNWDQSKLNWNLRQFYALAQNNITVPEYFKDLRDIHRDFLNFLTLPKRLTEECDEFFMLYGMILESQNRHYLGLLEEVDDDDNVLFKVVSYLSLCNAKLKLDIRYADLFPYLYKIPNNSYFTLLNYNEPQIKLIIDINNIYKYTYKDDAFSDKFLGKYANYLSNNLILNNFNNSSTLCMFKSLDEVGFLTTLRISPIRIIFNDMNLDVIEISKFAEEEWNHKDQIKLMNEEMLKAAETDPYVINITKPSTSNQTEPPISNQTEPSLENSNDWSNSNPSKLSVFKKGLLKVKKLFS